MPRLWGVKGACIMLMLAPLLSASAFGQQSRVLLIDGKVTANEIEVRPDKPFSLPGEPNGVIWIALDPVTLTTEQEGHRKSRELHAGDAEFSGRSLALQFLAARGSHARLIVVHLKTPPSQPLTVLPFVLSPSSDIEDASARNETLLVALTESRFRDVRDLGDESEWAPSKPETVAMHAATVRWLRPGIHHFNNLNPTPARLVSIEW